MPPGQPNRRRLADEPQRDVHLELLGHRDAIEVDVQQVATERVALPVLHQHRRRLGARHVERDEVGTAGLLDGALGLALWHLKGC